MVYRGVVAARSPMNRYCISVFQAELKKAVLCVLQHEEMEGTIGAYRLFVYSRSSLDAIMAVRTTNRQALQI